MPRFRGLVALTAAMLIAAACGDSAETSTTAAAPAATEPASTEAADQPPLGPSSIEAADQGTVGGSIVVGTVTLPAPGFIAVHADADGPGPVIGNSDLLPEGTSTNVAVALAEPLTESTTLWPMVHIDLDGDGSYLFEPPDNAVDLPGTLANGDVAVVPVAMTFVPQGPSNLEATDQESDGTTIAVASVSLPTAGFIAVHADADGAPGPVIGNSDLLPAGDSAGVVVTLDQPLTESATVWPMVHVDVDGDGSYLFAPPDAAVDLPGVFDNGDVAVLPIAITVA